MGRVWSLGGGVASGTESCHRGGKACPVELYLIAWIVVLQVQETSKASKEKACKYELDVRFPFIHASLSLIWIYLHELEA